MTLEAIIEELHKLDIDFALVTRQRNSGLGAERLTMSLDRHGLPKHPAAGAWLLSRGIQRALDLCDSDPAAAVELSLATSELQALLGELGNAMD
jgi:hypothetical protein